MPSSSLEGRLNRSFQEEQIFEIEEESPNLSNSYSMNIQINNIEINNELNDRLENDNLQDDHEILNPIIAKIFSYSLFRVFLFLWLVGAITVFLQDVYFNFQDEKKVS